MAKVINVVKELPQKIWNSIINAVTRVATWGAQICRQKAKEVMDTMLTNIVTIVKETPVKIWNCIIGAVNKVATWGANMVKQSQRGNEYHAYGNREHCNADTAENLNSRIIGAVTKENSDVGREHGKQSQRGNEYYAYGNREHCNADTAENLE